MALLKKLQFSSLAICLVVLTCFIIDLSFKNWEKQDRVIEHDVHSYYAYLPAKFIYDDIKIEKSTYQFGDNYYLFWPSYTSEGKAVIKTTMGLSIMYSPFFFAAHWYASITDYPENGFSEPYKIFLLLSSIFYLIIGLDFLRKTLLHFQFSDAHIAVTILLVGLGTNLLCYSSQSATMGHAYSFCLLAVFIYYSIKWHEEYSIKNTIILGLLLGLISLIRPTNAIIILFFFLYGVSSWQGFKERLSFFRKECFLLNLICLFAFFVWIPQLIYWQTVTGSYFYYSFTDERFFFDRPRILEGLFSFRKGWLVYTPMMAFAILGLLLPVEGLKKLRFAITVFLALNVFIIFSWWCWWYGGSFGQRSMIDSYALFAIPLAYSIKFISEKKRILLFIFYGVAAFFIWLNIFQTYQYEKLTLHWEGMTKELYFKQFGKMEKIEYYDNYISYPDFEQAKKGNSFPSTPTFDQSKKAESVENAAVFLAANNKYVCAESDSMLYADKVAASTWETFSLKIIEKDICVIQAHTGLYLSTEMNHEQEITAKRKEIGAWEKFTMVNLGDGYIALKGVNNKFLGWDEKTFRIYAKSDSVGFNEKFKLIR